MSVNGLSRDHEYSHCVTNVFPLKQSRASCVCLHHGTVCRLSRTSRACNVTWTVHEFIKTFLFVVCFGVRLATAAVWPSWLSKCFRVYMEIPMLISTDVGTGWVCGTVINPTSLWKFSVDLWMDVRLSGNVINNKHAINVVDEVWISPNCRIFNLFRPTDIFEYFLHNQYWTHPVTTFCVYGLNMLIYYAPLPIRGRIKRCAPSVRLSVPRASDFLETGKP